MEKLQNQFFCQSPFLPQGTIFSKIIILRYSEAFHRSRGFRDSIFRACELADLRRVLDALFAFNCKATLREVVPGAAGLPWDRFARQFLRSFEFLPVKRAFYLLYVIPLCSSSKSLPFTAPPLPDWMLLSNYLQFAIPFELFDFSQNGSNFDVSYHFRYRWNQRSAVHSPKIISP